MGRYLRYKAAVALVLLKYGVWGGQKRLGGLGA